MARRTRTFSSRSASASKAIGGSIATRREQLQQVVLEDVAARAGLLVERAAALDAEVLGHGDLHVVDVAPVPERLEDAVAEAEDEQVADRLLAQVVVDAVDLRLVEDAHDRVVELRAADSRSWPNGFSTTMRAQPSRSPCLSSPTRPRLATISS